VVLGRGGGRELALGSTLEVELARWDSDTPGLRGGYRAVVIFGAQAADCGSNL